jgi:hypothetical protein
VWTVGRVGYINTISQPTGKRKRYFSDKIKILYMKLGGLQN